MLKSLAAVMMLSLSFGVAEAKTGLLEECIFNETRKPMMLVKDTTGEIGQREFTNIGKRAKDLCLTKDRLNEKENLNNEEANEAIIKGFRRAIRYVVEGRNA